MAKGIGIRDLGPYSCRHTTATALALGGSVAPLLITKIMRQKRPFTTELYKHAEEQQVLNALNQLELSPITKVDEKIVCCSVCCSKRLFLIWRDFRAV